MANVYKKVAGVWTAQTWRVEWRKSSGIWSKFITKTLRLFSNTYFDVVPTSYTGTPNGTTSWRLTADGSESYEEIIWYGIDTTGYSTFEVNLVARNSYGRMNVGVWTTGGTHLVDIYNITTLGKTVANIPAGYGTLTLRVSCSASGSFFGTIDIDLIQMSN